MPDSLQAVPSIVWWLLAGGAVLLLLDPNVRGLAGKLLAWLRGLVPQPWPQPGPLPLPASDPIAAYRYLKSHCGECPAEVQAAFRTIWVHLDDPHAPPLSHKGGGRS